MGSKGETERFLFVESPLVTWMAGLLHSIKQRQSLDKGYIR